MKTRIALLSALSLLVPPLSGCGYIALGAVAGIVAATGGGGGGKNTAPGVALPTIARETDFTVTVPFTLFDDESNTIDLAVEFDRGSGYQPATGITGNTGLASSPAGTSGSIAWDATADLAGAPAVGVKVRLTPSDSATGAPAESNPFTIGNDPPVVAVTPILGIKKGLVRVDFTLADSTLDPTDVSYFYETEAALGTWIPATITIGDTTDIATTTAPQSHAVAWDTVADLGANERTQVRLRALPNDGIVDGTEVIVGPFTVANQAELLVKLGPQTPVAATHVSDEAGVVLMQLRVQETSGAENATLTHLVLRDVGSANQPVDVRTVRLVLDNDSDGVLDVTDTDLVVATPPVYSSQRDLDFTGLSVTVPAAGVVDLLLAYDLQGTAVTGTTLAGRLRTSADVDAVGVVSAKIAPVILNPTGGVQASTATLQGIGAVSLALSPVPAISSYMANDAAAEVFAVDIQETSGNEDAVVNRLTVQAVAGGLNEVADVSLVDVYLDTNDNGIFDGVSVDPAIATGATYGADDGIVDITGLSATIVAGTRARWLVVYRLAGTAATGAPMAARLASNAAVVAAGASSTRPLLTSGAPVDGPVHTIQGIGRLALTENLLGPGAHGVSPGAATVILAIEVQETTSNEGVNLSSIVFTGAGSADEALDIDPALVQLYRDNGTTVGVLDGSDTPLDLGGYTGDNGTFEAQFAPLAIPAGGLERFLLVYDTAAGVLPGRTFSARIIAANDVIGVGASTGIVVPIVNVPLDGPLVTVGRTVQGIARDLAGAPLVSLPWAVKLSINGGTPVSASTDATGAFSFFPVGATDADVIVAYFDGGVTGGVRGFTVSRIGADVPDFDVRGGRLTVRDDRAPAAAIGNSDLAEVDGIDADIQFSVDGSNALTLGLGFDLHVQPNDSFVPQGGVTLAGGSLFVGDAASTSTYDGGANVTSVGGAVETLGTSVLALGASGTLKLTGPLTLGAPLTLSQTSRVEFAGATPQALTAPGSTLGRLVVLPGATVETTLDATADVLEVQDGGTFRASSVAPTTTLAFRDVTVAGPTGVLVGNASPANTVVIQVAGNWTVGHAAGFDPGAGTSEVQFTVGPSTLMASNHAFDRLTVLPGISVTALDVFRTNGQADVRGTLTLGSGADLQSLRLSPFGTLIQGASDLFVRQALQLDDNSTWIDGSGNVVFTEPATWTDSHAGGPISIGGVFIGATANVVPQGFGVRAGALSVFGTLDLETGNVNVTAEGNVTVPAGGSINALTRSLIFGGADAQTVSMVGPAPAPSNLRVDKATSAATVTVLDPLTFDNLTVAEGTIVFQAGASLIRGNAEVQAGGTLKLTGGSLTLGDGAGDTFTVRNGGALVIDGSAPALTFAAGSTTTVEAGGALTLLGRSGARALLRSTTAGVRWNLVLMNAAGTDAIEEVDVQDSDASGGSTVEAFSSTNSGNNLNWFFGTPFPANIGGTVYTDRAMTLAHPGGNSVQLWVDGTFIGSQPIGPLGTYSFAGVTVRTGSRIFVALENDGERGTAFTRMQTTDVNDLNIATGHVIVRTERTIPVTSLDLNKAPLAGGDPADVELTLLGNDLTVTNGHHLIVGAGDEFAPSGLLTLAGGGDLVLRGKLSGGGNTLDLSSGGDVVVEATGIFALGNGGTLNLGGNWSVAAGGTLQDGLGGSGFHSGSTVVLSGPGPHSIASGGLGAARAFGAFTVGGAANLLQGTSFKATVSIPAGATLDLAGNVADIDGKLAITGGTLGSGSPGGRIDLAGDWTYGSGTLNRTNLSLVMNGSGTQRITAAGATLPAVTVQSGTTAAQDPVDIDGGLLVTGGTFDLAGQTVRILDNPAGSDARVNGGGTLTDTGSGTFALLGTGLLGGAGTTTLDRIDLAAAGRATTLDGPVTTGRVVMGGGTLSLGGAGNTLTLDGNGTPFSASGTFVPFGAAVRYTGVDTTTPIQVAAVPYFGLTIDAAGSGTTFALSGATAVAGNLAITSGTLDTGSTTNYALDVDGNLTLTSTLRANASAIAFSGATFDVAGGTFTPGTSQVTFDGSGVQTAKPGTQRFFGFTVNGTANDVRPDATLDVDGVLLVQSGTLNLGASNVALKVAGNLTVQPGAGFTPGTTATFDGTALQTWTWNSANPVGDLVVSNAVGLQASGTVRARGVTVNALARLAVPATATLIAEGSYSASATGVLDAQGLVRFTGSGVSVSAGGQDANHDFAAVDILSAGTVTISGSACRIGGPLTVSSGTLAISAATELLGDTTVAWGTSLRSVASGIPILIGDGPDTLRILTLGSFVLDAGGIQLTVNDLATVDVDGDLQWTGRSGNPLILRSSTPGTQWTLSVDPISGQNISYVDVRDSDATSGVTVVAPNSVDSGNNLNWVFGQVFPIGGTVYTDQGVTPAGAGLTVSVAVDGGTVRQGTTDGSGQYTITNVDLAVGKRVIVYLDGGTTRGATVLRANGVAIANAHVYQDHVIVRSEDGGAVGNVDLSVADNGDPDIPYLVTSGNLTLDPLFDLLVWGAPATQFSAGGNVTADEIDLVPGASYTVAAARTHAAAAFRQQAFGSTATIGGTLDVNGPAEIGGTFTLASGAFLKVAGNLNVYGFAITNFDPAAMLDIDGGVSQNIFSLNQITCPMRVRTAGTTARVLSTLLGSSAVTVEAGATLDLAGLDLTMVAGSDLSVSGTLRIASGTGSTSTVAVGGDVSISAGGVIRATEMAGDTSTITVGGSWTALGTNGFLRGTGSSTVRFTGTDAGSPTLSPDNSAFGALDVNTPGETTQVGGALVANGLVTVTAGTLKLNPATGLTANAGVSVLAGATFDLGGESATITGNFSNAGTVQTTVASGTVTLNSSGNLGGTGSTTLHDLVCAKVGATTSVAGNVTARKLTYGPGTLSLGTFTLTLTGKGTPLDDSLGGTFNAGTGTVIYSGTDTLPISVADLAGGTYYHLTINGAATTFPIQAATRVAGNLLIQSGTLDTQSIIPPATALDVEGNLTIQGSLAAGTSRVQVAGNFDAGTTGSFSFTPGGEVVLDGAGAQTVVPNASTFQDLTVTKAGGTVSSAVGLTVRDDLTMNGGNVQPGGILDVDDDLLVNVGTLVQGGDVRVGGDFRVAAGAGFTASGKLFFDGTAAQVWLDQANVPTFGQVTVSTTGTGVVQLQSAVKVTSYTGSAGSQIDLTNASASITCAGSWSNSGTVTEGTTARITFTGTVASTFSPGTDGTYPSITVNTPSTLTLTGQNCYLTRDLVVQQGTFNIGSFVLQISDPTNDAPADLSVSLGATVQVGAGGMISFGPSEFGQVFGTLRLQGISGNPAILTSTTPGTDRYTFRIEAGGTLDAVYYRVDSAGVAGLNVLAGASIVDLLGSGLDNGEFLNILPGAGAGGAGLTLGVTPPGDVTLSNLKFNTSGTPTAGADPRNITYTGGAGPKIFVQTSGSTQGNLFGDAYDNDPGDSSGSSTMSQGQVRWADPAVGPSVTLVETQDLDKDGQVDAYRVTWDRWVEDSTYSGLAANATSSLFTLTGFLTFPAADTADDNVTYVEITEVGDPNTEKTGNFQTSLSGVIRGSGVNAATIPATAAADLAGPALLWARYVDANGSDSVDNFDRVEIHFSENITQGGTITPNIEIPLPVAGDTWGTAAVTGVAQNRLQVSLPGSQILRFTGQFDSGVIAPGSPSGLSIAFAPGDLKDTPGNDAVSAGPVDLGMSFNQVVTSLVSGSPTDLALASISQDGDLDGVYTSSGNAPRGLRGRNDGTFPTGVTYGPINCFRVVFGYFDPDGILDEIVAPQNGTADIRESDDVVNDDVRFPNLLDTVPTASLQDVAVADLDGVNGQDLVFARTGSLNEVWLNNGSPAPFNAAASQSFEPGDTRAVAVGNLGGDPKPDLFFANAGPIGSTVWLNNGGGFFVDSGQTLLDPAGLTTPMDVVLGDLDGDGDQDAIMGYQGGSRVWLNDGTGLFAAGQRLGTSQTISSLLLIDLDADGDLDLYEGDKGGAADQVWIGQGDGTFVNVRHPDTLMADTQAVRRGDADGDGAQDIVLAHGTQAQVATLESDAAAFVLRFQAGPVIALGSSIESIVAADMDGDLDTDLAAGSGVGGPSFVLFNDGFGNFTQVNLPGGGPGEHTIVAGQLTGDPALLDVILALGGGGNAFIEQQGAQNFVLKSNFGGTSAQDAVLADFDGNGWLDLAVATAGVEQVFWNDGLGNFTGGPTFGGQDTRGIDAGNLGGDPLPDLVLGHFGGGAPDRNELYQNVPGGPRSFNFAQQFYDSCCDNTQHLVLGDIDGDGDLDCVSMDENKLDVFKQDAPLDLGPSRFQRINVTGSVNGGVLRDMDGDGDLDAVVSAGGVGNDFYIFTNPGNGSFSDPAFRSYGLGEGVESLAVLDYDGDGDLDVATASRTGPGGIRIWIRQ